MQVKKSGVFILGTDTGVGKTVVSSLLFAALRQYKMSANYFKPLQTGTELDTETVALLNGVAPAALPKPSYYFSEPASPLQAAALEGQTIDLNQIAEDWRTLRGRNDYWIVESAGGLLSPIGPSMTNRDLLKLFDLGLILVASTRLGTINHTALTVEAVRKIGLEVTAIVLTGAPKSGLPSLLEKMTGVKVVAEIPHFSALSPNFLQQISTEYFNLNLLSSFVCTTTLSI